MRYLHAMVRVHDLDEALDFYCNKLGLIEFNRSNSEAGRYTLFFYMRRWIQNKLQKCTHR
jgi:lactoylglutathione lyase